MDIAQKNTNNKVEVSYEAASEFGCDYLRDNVVRQKEEKVQRGLNIVLIDEADSILIDEARFPLLMSDRY
ncbi:hypothetical protein AWI95_14720 [Listeria monocytogenes]|nr:hypothetical protein AWI95_14720 [Listeria monocytogenes]